MNIKYNIEIEAKQELALVAKVLLFLQRKMIKVKRMNLEDSLENGSYRYSFHVECSYDNMAKTSRLISKQEGILLVNYNQV